MSKVTYHIVEHDGGWAYKSDGVFSEPFPTRREAIDAAHRAAVEQQLPDLKSASIEWEDENGVWHAESSRGDDRPVTAVEE